jgi:hypothetical protein
MQFAVTMTSDANEIETISDEGLDEPFSNEGRFEPGDLDYTYVVEATAEGNSK